MEAEEKRLAEEKAEAEKLKEAVNSEMKQLEENSEEDIDKAEKEIDGDNKNDIVTDKE